MTERPEEQATRRRVFATSSSGATLLGGRAATAAVISVLIIAGIVVGLHTTGSFDLLRASLQRSVQWRSPPARPVQHPHAQLKAVQHAADAALPCAPLNGSTTTFTNFTADLEALRRGVLTLGDGHRMRRFMAKLTSGQAVTIVAFGGSITAGQGAVYGNPYVERFYRWVQQAFPNPAHRLRNTAIGGTGSMTFAACARTLVEDADFAFLEFVINDPDLGVPLRSATVLPENPNSAPALKSYERLLRFVLQLPSRPAVALLHHYSWFNGGGGEGRVPPFYNTIEVEYTTIGEYYSLPQVSVRNAFYPLMVEDRPGYQARTWRVGHENTTQEADLFYYDMSHPQDGTGHLYLAELLEMLLLVGAEDLAARPAGPADDAAAAAPLPAPMVPGNYERLGLACVMGLPLEFAAVEHRGFEFVLEKKNKWGWVGTEPGAELVLRVDTRSQYSLLKAAPEGAAVGVTEQAPPALPPKLELLVNYLYSYEHMGRFRLSCRSGCTCAEVEVDGHSTTEHHSQSRPANGLYVSEHAECLIAVTVLNESSSGEHKVKITGFMLVEHGMQGTSGEALELLGQKLEDWKQEADTAGGVAT